MPNPLNITVLDKDGTPQTISTLDALLAYFLGLTGDSPTEAHQPTVTSSLAPAIQTAAYTAGRVLFTPAPMPNAIRANDVSSLLTSLGLIDRSNQKPDLKLMFFKGNPASFGAVNAALGLNAADSVLFTGAIDIAAADWVTLNGIAYWSSTRLKQSLSQVLTPAVGTSQTYIGGLLTGAGTPTFGNVADFIINAGVLQG